MVMKQRSPSGIAGTPSSTDCSETSHSPLAVWWCHTVCVMFVLVLIFILFFKCFGMTNWKHTQHAINMYMLSADSYRGLVSSANTATESRGSGRASVL